MEQFLHFEEFWEVSVVVVKNLSCVLCASEESRNEDRERDHRIDITESSSA